MVVLNRPSMFPALSRTNRVSKLSKNNIRLRQCADELSLEYVIKN